jgi:hypothetical protein
LNDVYITGATKYIHGVNIMSYTGYQEITKEELKELEEERLELLASFKLHLENFCKYLNLDLDQQAAFHSISWSLKSRLENPKHTPEKTNGVRISGKGHISLKMIDEVKSVASTIVNDLACKIAASSQQLLCNDIALRGSPELIAVKLTHRYLFGHKHFYDISATPDVPSVHHYEIDAFSKYYLLDRVQVFYESQYHRYKLWDGRSIALFNSCLFDTKSQEHTFFNSPNLIHLLGDDPELIDKKWFKEECIQCWLELNAEAPLHQYTELAYPDDDGVIFAEYVPLTMVGEDVWDALYERYQHKLKNRITHHF